MGGGYPCCRDAAGSTQAPVREALPCLACQPGTTAAEYQVDITGMIDRSIFRCEICDLLNGTFVLSQIDTCLWRLNFDPICNYSRMDLAVLTQNTGVIWELKIMDPSTSENILVLARFVSGVLSNCRVTALTLSAQGQPGNCQHQLAMASITGLYGMFCAM
jgi:hypothetical protein